LQFLKVWCVTVRSPPPVCELVKALSTGLNRSVSVLFLQFLSGDLLLFLSPCPWVFLVGEEGVRGLPTVP